MNLDHNSTACSTIFLRITALSSNCLFLYLPHRLSAKLLQHLASHLLDITLFHVIMHSSHRRSFPLVLLLCTRVARGTTYCPEDISWNTGSKCTWLPGDRHILRYMRLARTLVSISESQCQRQCASVIF